MIDRFVSRPMSWGMDPVNRVAFLLLGFRGESVESYPCTQGGQHSHHCGTRRSDRLEVVG